MRVFTLLLLLSSQSVFAHSSSWDLGWAPVNADAKLNPSEPFPFAIRYVREVEVEIHRKYNPVFGFFTKYDQAHENQILLQDLEEKLKTEYFFYAVVPRDISFWTEGDGGDSIRSKTVTAYGRLTGTAFPIQYYPGNKRIDGWRLEIFDRDKGGKTIYQSRKPLPVYAVDKWDGLRLAKVYIEELARAVEDYQTLTGRHFTERNAGIFLTPTYGGRDVVETVVMVDEYASQFLGRLFRPCESLF